MGGRALGHALVNLEHSEDVESLMGVFTGFLDWCLPASSCCSASVRAPRQTLPQLVERYRNSPVMHPSVPDEYKPAMFDSAGKRLPFPAPTVPYIKPPRVRHIRSSESPVHVRTMKVPGQEVANRFSRNEQRRSERHSQKKKK